MTLNIILAILLGLSEQINVLTERQDRQSMEVERLEKAVVFLQMRADLLYADMCDRAGSTNEAADWRKCRGHSKKVYQWMDTGRTGPRPVLQDH